MTPFDVEAVRRRFSSLRPASCFFDAPGGSQVPDEVGDAIAKHPARREREPRRALRDGPARRADRRRGEGARRPLPQLLARRGRLRHEHDDAQLRAHAHVLGRELRGGRRDPRHPPRPRRQRRALGRARRRPRPRRPARRHQRRLDARPRRPRVEAVGAHAGRLVPVGLERDRHARRRAARGRARPRRRRDRLGRRRPLRRPRADGRAGDRRRRRALLALQVLRPAPRHGLRARVARRDLAAVQGAARRRRRRPRAASRPARCPTSCSAG